MVWTTFIATVIWVGSAAAVDISGTVREAETGRPLGGFFVTFEGASVDQRGRVAEDGSFLIDAPEASTVLEVLNANGDSFGRFAPLAGQIAIEVEPSGHIYASDTGAGVAGVRVRLLRGGAQVGSLRTGRHGLYRFELPGAGSYQIEVDVDQQTVHFPSLRVPPMEGSALFDETTGLVDAPAAPDPKAPSAYWLRFDATAGLLLAPRHNHIAVDRAGALIAIQKAASHGQISVGQAITYTIRVENRSGQDFLRAGDRGGVVIRDVLPPHTKLVAESTRASIDGVPVSLAAPEDPRILQFRLAGEDESRAFELPRGAKLFVRYQVIVGADARAGKVLRNRARVVGTDGLALSDEAVADVRLVADPIFDSSWLRGRVYCDQDGDGFAGARDPGVYGARVYIDTGRYAVTDSQGRFHISEVPPGLHLIKVDTDTVPPGSEEVTPSSRNVHFTRGFPVQLTFGFRCNTSEVPPTRVIPAGDAEPPDTSGRLVITGSLGELGVSVGGTALGGKGSPIVTLEGTPASGKIHDVPWSPGAWTRTLGIGLVGPDGAGDGGSWRVWIEAKGGGTPPRSKSGARWRAIRAWGGAGPPPASLQWDGTGGSGATPVAELGRVHRVWLEVTDGRGSRWISRPVRFTVGRGRKGPAIVETYSADLFDRRGRLHRKLKRFLKGLKKSLKTVGSPQVMVTLGVGEGAGAAGMQAGRQSLEIVAAALVQRAGVARVHVGTRVVEETPVLNVTVYDATQIGDFEPTRGAPPAKSVTIDGAPVEADERGRFVAAIPAPEDGAVVIELNDGKGARREVLHSQDRSAGSAELAVRAALGAGQLRVAGSNVSLDGLRLRVNAPWQKVGLVEGAPEVPIELHIHGAAEKTLTWSLAVTGPAGATVFEKGGPATPPDSVVWEPTAQLSPGGYTISLEIETEHGTKVTAPPRTLALVDGALGVARGTVQETFRGKLFGRGNTLQRGFVKKLTRLARTLKARPGTRYLIEAHTDGKSSPAVAKVTAGVQARRVRGLLVLKGLEEGRVESVGVGADRPLASPKTRRGRKQNARIEVRLLPTFADGAPTREWGLEVDGEVIAASATGRAMSPLEPVLGQPFQIVVLGRHGQRLAASIEPPKVEEAKAAPKQSAPFGVSTLSRALAHQVATKQPPPPIAAAALRVELPGAGATLGQGLLPIRGSVPPGEEIVVWIAGKVVPVDSDGKFEALLPLPEGESSRVVIRARDKVGNVARVERSFRVKGNAWFLMVLADGAVSQHATRLDQETSTLDVGPVLLHGRGALYLKARVKGGALIESVRFTAFADTARKEDFSSFVDQVIDPDRYYPVYGDSSTEGTDARTRGKFYVAIEAERNKLIVGTFRASEWGVDLLRYDRVMDGVQLRVDQEWTPGYTTVVEGFVNHSDHRVRRSHATLRATGGSYYFLPDREVIEGSEQVLIAIYDRDSGARLSTVAQARDVDYFIDYAGGRLTFMKPIASRVDASFLVGAADVLSARLGLEGHEVRIQVDYETRSQNAIGDATWGVNGSQTFAGLVTVGGGYVREGRAVGNGPDYELVGGTVSINPTDNTSLEAEVGYSTAGTGANVMSDDGGLTFRAVGEAPQATQRGWGVTVRGRTDIGEFMGKEDPFLEIGAQYQRQDRGFSASHTALEGGAERASGSLTWHIDRERRVTLRHDTLLTHREDAALPDAERQTDRYLTSAQYVHRMGALTLVGDLLHARENDEGQAEVDRGALAALVKYRISPRVSLWGEQQVLLGGDDRVFRSFGDHAVTGLGVDLTITDDLSMTIGERVRWSGEDAAVLGFRTKLSDTSQLYFEQRLLHSRDSHRWVPATVVGSEERWGADSSGRSYGEYQVGNAGSGAFNRAVLGIGRRFRVVPWFNADVAFERYHTTVVDGKGTERNGNTLSLGGEVVGHAALKLTTRFEARFEGGDVERLQLVSFNRLVADLSKGVSLFARADLAMTQNQELDQREAETVDVQIGLAYRPLDEGFSLLVRAGHIVDMRPVALDPLSGSVRTSASVISLEPIVELPVRLQITPKLAWRHAVEEAEGASAPVKTNTILGGLRFAFHLLQRLDIAAEYRWLWLDTTDQMEHGALGEIAVTISRYARIGAGYNFSRFDDDLFDPRNDHGFFVRLTGMY